VGDDGRRPSTQDAERDVVDETGMVHGSGQ
jgi:hypothetical protein